MPTSSFNQGSDYPDILHEFPPILTWILNYQSWNRSQLLLPQTLSICCTYSSCFMVHYKIFAVDGSVINLQVLYTYSLNLHVPNQLLGWASAVSIATRLRAGWTRVWILVGDFLLYKHVQTCSGVHPASTAMGSSQSIKAAEAWR
jgi:hypothetical protein